MILVEFVLLHDFSIKVFSLLWKSKDEEEEDDEQINVE